jgi:hypothetical protein
MVVIEAGEASHTMVDLLETLIMTDLPPINAPALTITLASIRVAKTSLLRIIVPSCRLYQ